MENFVDRFKEFWNDFKKEKIGSGFSPLTSIFAIMGKETPYLL